MIGHGIVGFPTIDGWRGVYVHRNTAPDELGEEVRKIIAREGEMVAIDVLCDLNRSWLEVKSNVEEEGSIPGFGFPPQDYRSDGWLDSSHTQSGLEWAYIIFHEEIHIWRNVGKKWVRIRRWPIDKVITSRVSTQIQNEIRDAERLRIEEMFS